MTGTLTNSASIAGAIGMVNDRTIIGGEHFCSAWLISDYRAATIASALIPFAEHPEAISVAFPKAGKECAVVKISFHPQFDLKACQERIRRGIPFDSWESTLQKYNCAILHLSDELSELSEQDFTAIAKAFELQAETKDGFSGSLKNLELPVVFQTIISARQEGILYICDQVDRPLAQMFFQGGNLISARYKNLANELAIYQIIQKKIGGKFVFKDCEIRDWVDWLPQSLISKTPDMLLIESMRRLDELAKLRAMLREDKTYYVRAQTQLDLENISEELRNIAGLVWRVLDGMTIAEQLWLLIGLDDYTIFRVLEEMYRKGLIRRVQEGGTRQLSSADLQAQAPANWLPIPLGLELPLFPGEQITSVGVDIDAGLGYANADGTGRSLASRFGHSVESAGKLYGSKDREEIAASIRHVTIDALTTKTRVKSDAILGAIDAYDSQHILHEIPLLPSAGGTPIFKDGLVVGMHCGVVPSSAELDNSSGIIQMMIWVEVVSQCLKSAGEQEFSRKFIQPIASKDKASRIRKPIRPPGCNQIAALKCPSCGQETYDSARSCAKCKHKFVPILRSQDESTKAELPVEKAPFLADLATYFAVIPVAILFALFAYWMTLEKPSFQTAEFVLDKLRPAEPADQLVKLRTMLAEDPSAPLKTWIAQESNCKLENNALVQFRVDAFQASYVYLIYKGRWSKTASLMFPAVGDKTNLLPARMALHTSKFRIEPPKGSETILVVASKQPIDWMTDPKLCNALFECAAHLPISDITTTGVMVDLDRFLQNAGNNPTSQKTSSNALYLSYVTVDHL